MKTPGQPDHRFAEGRISFPAQAQRCSGGLPTVEARGVAANDSGFAGWFFDRRLGNRRYSTGDHL